MFKHAAGDSPCAMHCVFVSLAFSNDNVVQVLQETCYLWFAHR